MCPRNGLGLALQAKKACAVAIISSSKKRDEWAYVLQQPASKCAAQRRGVCPRNGLGHALHARQHTWLCCRAILAKATATLQHLGGSRVGAQRHRRLIIHTRGVSQLMSCSDQPSTTQRSGVVCIQGMAFGSPCRHHNKQSCMTVEQEPSC
jgi:hypothetical protein